MAIIILSSRGMLCVTILDRIWNIVFVLKSMQNRNTSNIWVNEYIYMDQM